jgi:hypothetical protein
MGETFFQNSGIVGNMLYDVKKFEGDVDDIDLGNDLRKKENNRFCMKSTVMQHATIR